MKKLKQLLALLVVILLLGLYALTLVFALMKSPAAQDLLLASLYATVILPIEAVGDAMFASDDWVEADRGVRTEEEILQSFIDNDPEYEKQIRDAFDDMGFTIHTFSYTRTWLKYLKQRGYKLYYLSNFSKPLFERCTQEMEFLNLMDGGYMSWEVQMIKPDAQFYQKLLKDFKIEPSKAVFLDDVMENIAEARAQGLNAVHFTNKKEAIRALKDDFGVE